MMTVFDSELVYCIRARVKSVEALSSRKCWFGNLSKCRAAISVSSELHGGFPFSHQVALSWKVLCNVWHRKNIPSPESEMKYLILYSDFYTPGWIT